METVAPHAGAWIETSIILIGQTELGVSHPTRVRGLKQRHRDFVFDVDTSHPTRVRGLKQLTRGTLERLRDVAPHAGAWIETTNSDQLPSISMTSHPTRVRGLKPKRVRSHESPFPVAPHAGAWIETQRSSGSRQAGLCRTPRGCVD